jgi:serine phosphatase RsbU (regulator of sigma subunit)
LSIDDLLLWKMSCDDFLEVLARKESALRSIASGLRPYTESESSQSSVAVKDLALQNSRLLGLLEAVLAISREVELPGVLRQIVTTAMNLVGARYGALGVLHESGEWLGQFVTAGLSDQERADLKGVDFPRDGGLLGHMIQNQEPIRVDNISSHPAFVGFPAGHPHLRTLLGVAVTVRGEIYGDLYLSERHDGRPFDSHDEDIVVALAGAAGIAIEKVRLLEQARARSEQFQRLLLPRLPDSTPFDTAAVYRPAAEPNQLGGDWYDALPLPDGALAVVIGDVAGHDLTAAATMASTRNMLRALLFDRLTSPSAVLTQLDRTLQAITDSTVITTSLARIESHGAAWRIRWSSAGHPPPLLITKEGRAEYLLTEPDVPLGVDAGQPRNDATRHLPPEATVVFFTDGLVERTAYSIEQGLQELAELAAERVTLPLQEYVQFLADHHPGDGHDDVAILALRTPPTPDH